MAATMPGVSLNGFFSLLLVVRPSSAAFQATSLSQAFDVMLAGGNKGIHAESKYVRASELSSYGRARSGKTNAYEANGCAAPGAAKLMAIVADSLVPKRSLVQDFSAGPAKRKSV